MRQRCGFGCASRAARELNVDGLVEVEPRGCRIERSKILISGALDDVAVIREAPSWCVAERNHEL